MIMKTMLMLLVITMAVIKRVRIQEVIWSWTLY